MKNAKKLTLAEKKALSKAGFDPKEWLRAERSFDGIKIVNVNNGETMWFRY